ncbi:MAG TPA: hypothetical protein PKC78_11900, partial [Accumulibacter sp.]|uniref:hypothetical protein n=1 Tax=Accumulibacter sp. TaxID=2053492 RepID=UPI002CD7C59C
MFITAGPSAARTGPAKHEKAAEAAAPTPFRATSFHLITILLMPNGNPVLVLSLSLRLEAVKRFV